MSDFIKRLFCRHEKESISFVNTKSVTLSWGFKPTLAFEEKFACKKCKKPMGETIKCYPRDLENKWYGEFYKHGEWPTDPETAERLPIHSNHR